MAWKPRVGHIGCGGRAQHVMQAMCGHVEFASCCDLLEARAQATQQAFGFQTYTLDWRELIADPDVEFINIVLPPDANSSIVLEAAPLRKPIWTEKPLDWRLEPAIEMVRVCRTHQTPLAVGQQYRYSDARQTVRREAVPITRASGDPDPGKGSGANTILLLEYLDCIQKGVPSPTSGEDHLKSLAMAEAAYLSSRTGLPVKVEDVLQDQV